MNFDLSTFLFQVVNFLVLVAILWRFLWKPLRRHMADRAERIAAGLRAIDEEQAELEEKRARLEQKLVRAKSAGDEARQQGEREAEERAAQILKAAHESATREGERLRAQALSEQDRREKEFLRTLVPDLTRLVARMLTELGGGELHELACDRFAREIEGLSPEERDELRSQASGAQIDLVSAEPKSTKRLVEAVVSLLPGDLQPTLKKDASLGAGARLCIGETVLDGSLAAQATAAMESAE